MPAKHPRLTITLRPSLAAQLRRLSELTGNSQSGFIGQLLEGSEPVFDRLIQVLEAAKVAKESIKGKLADDLQLAQSKIESALGVVFTGMDQLNTSILDAAKEAPLRARRGPAKRGGIGPGAAPPTPISNRGVRSTAKPPKTEKQKA